MASGEAVKGVGRLRGSGSLDGGDMTFGAIDIPIYDLAALILFLLVSVGYHKYYFSLSLKDPRRTMKGRMSFYRKSWIKRVREDRNGILAVQSLRNLSMVTVFLASTALIFLGTAITYFYDIEQEVMTGGRASIYEGGGTLLYHAKALLLLLTIAVAFFNFLKSLRELNYLTILVNASDAVIERIEGMKAEDLLAKLLNGAVIRYTIGVRCSYYALVILLWFFSTTLFIVGGILMTLSLIFYNDFRVYKA